MIYQWSGAPWSSQIQTYGGISKIVVITPKDIFGWNKFQWNLQFEHINCLGGYPTYGHLKLLWFWRTECLNGLKSRDRDWFPNSTWLAINAFENFHPLKTVWQPRHHSFRWLWSSDLGRVSRSIKDEEKEVKGEAEAEENEEDKDKASLINVDSWMRPKHAFLHAFPKGIIFIHRYGKGQMFGLFQTLNVLLVDRSASPTKNEKGGDAYSNMKNLVGWWYVDDGWCL